MGLKDWLTKNLYVTRPEDSEPFFRPRRYQQARSEVLRVVQEVAGSLPGWRVEEVREAQGLVRAGRSVLFPPSAQDVRIYVVQGQDGVTALEVTSQSRGSKGDWGRNKKNLREFLAKLDERLKPLV